MIGRAVIAHLGCNRVLTHQLLATSNGEWTRQLSDNTTRALEQVVSIDGWIAEFGEDNLANVHVDVVFRQGLFGEGDDAKVRFKIALKRAEIVVRVPDHEPLRVRKSSVRRTPIKSLGTQTTTRKTRSSFGGFFKAKASSKPDADAGFEAEASRENSKEIHLKEDLLRHLDQHFTTPDGHHAWEVFTNKGASEYLLGPAWDAADPVLKVERILARNADGDKPTVMIEIRCRRADIEIIDLEEKDPAARDFYLRKTNREMSLAAAEQIIREELERIGFLDIPDVTESASRIMIADKIILED